MSPAPRAGCCPRQCSGSPGSKPTWTNPLPEWLRTAGYLIRCHRRPGLRSRKPSDRPGFIPPELAFAFDKSKSETYALALLPVLGGSVQVGVEVRDRP